MKAVVLEPEVPMEDEPDVAVAQNTNIAVQAQNRIRSTLLALAREIRTPGKYVGYSAFILMALLFKRRPIVWEGRKSWDLLQHYAGWAEWCQQECAVDAIPCSLKATENGNIEILPVSEQNPLHRSGRGC